MRYLAASGIVLGSVGFGVVSGVLLSLLFISVSSALGAEL